MTKKLRDYDVAISFEEIKKLKTVGDVRKLAGGKMIFKDKIKVKKL